MVSGRRDAVGSFVRAQAIARDEDLAFIHPYDDPKVIAGQGTVALELLEDVPDVDTIGRANRRRRIDLRHCNRRQGA